ncbi:hypothetical protein GY45DRAFT_1116107 [Cubamyces sp. BRFM 1775]|nr:hypothetical protein GY45DRAFT_1116107 [Cubamyces sp. BRFM 1775]
MPYALMQIEAGADLREVEIELPRTLPDLFAFLSSSLCLSLLRIGSHDIESVHSADLAIFLGVLSLTAGICCSAAIWA